MSRRSEPGLRVLLHGEHVADLRQTRRGLTLTYREEITSSLGVGALCLSVALPVATRAHQGDLVLNWCEGLLPEGEMRTTLEQHFAVRRGDTFSLLAVLGRDCAGAVSFSGDDEAATRTGQTTTTLSPDELADAVTALPQRPLGVDDQVRASLGGLQAKLLLVRTDHGWARPTSGTPSTHILKPDPRDLARPGLVVSEALTMRAAALAGITSAAVELVSIGGRRVIVVERYDRRVTAHGVTRVHQEDGCQALGIEPSGPNRYQSKLPTAPSFARLAQVLVDHALGIDGELVRLGEAMTVNVAVGNADGHARNHSFLLADGVLRLAPLYDVASTFPFVNASQLGLWVDDQPYLRYVTRGHLVREMRRWGMTRAAATDTVERTLTGLDDSLELAAGELGSVVDEPLLAATREHIDRVIATARG